MIRSTLIAIAVALASAAQAQEEVPEPVSSPAPVIHQQTLNRTDKTITVGGAYGIYSFLVPGKKGLQLTWLQNSRWTWEADYFSGDWGFNKYGINLVSLTEKLTTIKMRKYWASSFNLTAGIGEREMAFELGSTLLDRIPENKIPNKKLIEIKRYILTFGIGNRWHFPKGFTVGADWLEIAAPVGKARVQSEIVDAIENDSDRKNAKKAISYLQNLPTINVVKLSMGYSF